LTHTSGIPDYPELNVIVQASRTPDLGGLQKLRNPAFPPGQKFNAATAATWFGVVVENISDALPRYSRTGSSSRWG
jgi:CubicO group peptidase (beta-lactamase class C family)